MNGIEKGEVYRGKKILDSIKLSNGWHVIKTTGKLSPEDFIVRTVFSLEPQRSTQPKHAHFAIDLFGKLCADKTGGLDAFKAVVEVWDRADIKQVIHNHQGRTKKLPGYPLEYMLYALNWILEQEDINFKGRPAERQEILDKICAGQMVKTPGNRAGSQLAIALLADVCNGTHPVEALIKAGLRI